MSTIVALALFLLGALLASFVTVMSERVYTGQPWSTGRSRCNSCRRALGARDLVPIFSWALLRGRCRHCGSRLPASYMLTEVILGTLFVLSYEALGLTTALLFMLASLSVLAFIVLYDLRHTVVPPVASLLFVGLSFSVAFLTSTLDRFGLTLLTAGALALVLFLLYALSKGRAMGLGDAPVAFALALLVGSTDALPGLIFSFWIGALFGIVILLRRPGGPTMGIEVPFVPFMAAGFLLAYFTQWNPFPIFGL